jgi:hypothetical protein
VVVLIRWGLWMWDLSFEISGERDGFVDVLVCFWVVMMESHSTKYRSSCHKEPPAHTAQLLTTARQRCTRSCR